MNTSSLFLQNSRIKLNHYCIKLLKLTPPYSLCSYCGLLVKKKIINLIKIIMSTDKEYLSILSSVLKLQTSIYTAKTSSIIQCHLGTSCEMLYSFISLLI